MKCILLVHSTVILFTCSMANFAMPPLFSAHPALDVFFQFPFSLSCNFLFLIRSFFITRSFCVLLCYPIFLLAKKFVHSWLVLTLIAYFGVPFSHSLALSLFGKIRSRVLSCKGSSECWVCSIHMHWCVSCFEFFIIVCVFNWNFYSIERNTNTSYLVL